MILTDKVAIVTGAGQGIGRAIAFKLADSGASVVVSDLNEQTALETARHIEAKSGRAKAVKTDVIDKQEVLQLLETTVDEFGRIDILINNAGIARS
ncbi:MAG: SDR family NAD(P)-dependent oxidoreductase, partial [Anaerolineae bacterium]|nr:SDR family NAD(P)-dependent oxidoreductase [Anaerolineae bacterium]